MGLNAAPALHGLVLASTRHHTDCLHLYPCRNEESKEAATASLLAASRGSSSASSSSSSGDGGDEEREPTVEGVLSRPPLVSCLSGFWSWLVVVVQSIVASRTPACSARPVQGSCLQRLPMYRTRLATPNHVQTACLHCPSVSPATH